MNMYENEKEVGKNIYCSTFICCHNDHFGRTLSILKLNEVLNQNEDYYKYRFEIKPISINAENKINVFLINMFTENKPVGEKYDDMLNENGYITSLDILTSVYYYEVIPVNFNKFKE